MPNLTQPLYSSPRGGAHRPPPIVLPADADQSRALVLQYIQTADTDFDRAGAIEAMHARLQHLRDPDGGIDKTLDELAGHLMLLDALFQRFAAESIATKLPDHKAKFVKLALGAQASYARTAIAIEGLRAQKNAKVRLCLNQVEEGIG